MSTTQELPTPLPSPPAPTLSPTSDSSAKILSPTSDDDRHDSLASSMTDTLTARVTFKGSKKKNAGLVVRPLRIRKRALDLTSPPPVTPSSPATDVLDHFQEAETILKQAKTSTTLSSKTGGAAAVAAAAAAAAMAAQEQKPEGGTTTTSTTPTTTTTTTSGKQSWAKVTRASSFVFRAVTESKDGAPVPAPRAPAGGDGNVDSPIAFASNSRTIADLTEAEKQAYQFAAACILAPFATGTTSNMSTDTWAFLNSNSLLNRSTQAVGWFVDSVTSIVGVSAAKTPGEKALAKLMDEETDVALDFTIRSRDRQRYASAFSVLTEAPHPDLNIPKSNKDARNAFLTALKEFVSDFLGPDAAIAGVPSSTARSAAAWKDVFAAFAQKVAVEHKGLNSETPQTVALATVEFINLILAIHDDPNAAEGSVLSSSTRTRSSSNVSNDSGGAGNLRGGKGRTRAERVEAQRLEELRNAFGLTQLDHLTLLNRARVGSMPPVVLGQLKARAAAAESRDDHPLYGRSAWSQGEEGDKAWEQWKENELKQVESLRRFFEAQQALAEAAAKKKAEAEAARLSAMLIPNISSVVTGGASRRLLARSAKIQAKLCVEVLKAVELPALDSGGTSDPYVSLRLLSAKGDKISEKLETTVQHQNLNPEWNENFVLDITEPDGSLRVKVVDKDRHTRDDIIGEAVVPLGTVSDGTVHEMWLNIVPRFSIVNYHSYGGRVLVRLQVVEPSGAHLSTSAATAASGGESPAETHADKAAAKREGDPATRKELVEYSGVAWTELFNLLLDVLLGASLKEHKANQDAPPISPMVFWMLEEFANRYGLGSTRARLLYLDRLQKISHPTHWPVVLSSLTDVMDDLKAESGAVPLTIAEDKLFSDLLARYNEDVRLNIQKYKLYFPQNEPAGTLQTICDVLSVLFGKEPGVEHEAVNWTIGEYLRTGIAETWSQLVAVNEHIDHTKTFAGYTAVQLVGLADSIVEELETDIAYFSAGRAFPPSIDLAGMSGGHYVEEYVAALRLFTAACPTSALNKDMFELYFKVKDLQASLDVLLPEARDEGLERIPVTELWLPYVLAWVDETHAKVGEWTRAAVKVDSWEPISKDVMHSTSSVDMWAAWSQAVDYLSSLEWPGSLNPVLSGLCEAVADVVEEYVDCLTQEMAQKDVRTRLNNLEYVRRQLAKFIEELNDVDEDESNTEVLDEALRETFGVIRSAQGVLVDDIVGYLSPFISATINDLFKVVREEVERVTGEKDGGEGGGGSSWWGRRRSQSRSRSSSPSMRPVLDAQTVKLAMNALTDYLDAELGQYMDALYDAMFMRLLKGLWGVIAGVLEENVAPTSSRSRITPTDVALVHAALSPLHDFFYADGAGLSRTYLANHSADLLSLLECYSRPTSSLIAQYMADEASATTRSVMGSAMLRLLKARGAKSDREAGKFIEDMEKIEKLRDKWKEWIVHNKAKAEAESSEAESEGGGGGAVEEEEGKKPTTGRTRKEGEGGGAKLQIMSSADERRRRRRRAASARKRRAAGGGGGGMSALLVPPPGDHSSATRGGGGGGPGRSGSSESLASGVSGKSGKSGKSGWSSMFQPPEGKR